MLLPIERDFNGTPLPADQRASVDVRLEGDVLCIEVDAPYYADPPPPAAAGACDRLWEHEVVELFLADAADHYLEVELGPHGHHLVIELRGVRVTARKCLPIEYTSQITFDDVAAKARAPRGRFRGRARVPAVYLPLHVTRANAYAIHGAGAARAYHAHAPVPGAAPDFHRLECFVPIRL